MKKWILLIVFSSFQVHAYNEKIDIDTIRSPSTNLIITEVTASPDGEATFSKGVDKISPRQLACIKTQLELLKTALNKPENRKHLERFVGFNNLEVSINIPTSHWAEQLIRPGVYVNGKTLGISFLMFYNDRCDLLSLNDLDKEFLKVGVISDGIKLGLGSTDDINKATESVKSVTADIIKQIDLKK